MLNIYFQMWLSVMQRILYNHTVSILHSTHPRMGPASLPQFHTSCKFVQEGQWTVVD